jgi:short-subunit dehydrogenase
MSESLSQEVADFNIRVLIVEPGAFRTNFLGSGALDVTPASNAYKGTTVEKTLNVFDSMEGKQQGDPDKGAQRIYEVVTETGMGKGMKSYLRLLIGKDCFDRSQSRHQKVKENMDAMEEIAASTALDG